MKRLLRTSAGWALITLRRDGVSGKSVTLDTFDDAGWELDGKTWTTRYGYHDPNEPLHEFLATVLAIPEVEAAEVAADIEGPWFTEYAARGGFADDRKIEKIAYIAMAIGVAVIVLAVLGVALGVWLVAK